VLINGLPAALQLLLGSHALIEVKLAFYMSEVVSG